MFTFSPAISFFVNCETQEEVDAFWEKLSEGGEKKRSCGWLKDKYGVVVADRSDDLGSSCYTTRTRANRRGS